MEKTYQSRLMVENTAILEEIVGLRQQQAELLGYNDHATYIQEVRGDHGWRPFQSPCFPRCGWPRSPGP